MIKIQILETEAMRVCRPEAVKELFRAEDVNVINTQTHEVTYGDQVQLAAPVNVLKDWLLPFKKVWFNFGAMQLERFTLCDVSKLNW
jgi:hypothetical protein